MALFLGIRISLHPSVYASLIPQVVARIYYRLNNDPIIDHMAFFVDRHRSYS